MTGGPSHWLRVHSVSRGSSPMSVYSERVKTEMRLRRSLLVLPSSLPSVSSAALRRKPCFSKTFGLIRLAMSPASSGSVRLSDVCESTGLPFFSDFLVHVLIFGCAGPRCCVGFLSLW